MNAISAQTGLFKRLHRTRQYFRRETSASIETNWFKTLKIAYAVYTFDIQFLMNLSLVEFVVETRRVKENQTSKKKL